MKKKICFVVSSPNTAKAFLLKHFEYLSRNFEIYLVANFSNEVNDIISPFLTGIHSVKIERKINIVSDIKALILLTNYFKEQKFDAVHSVTPKAGLISILASWLAGINVRIHIFTGQVWHTKKGALKRLLMGLDKIIVRFATHILVDGKSQRDFLIKNNIIYTANSKVLGRGSISGVDTDRFLPDLNLKKQIRSELKIKPTDVVYIFMGRLNFDKGVLDLVKAFVKLSKKVQNTKLLLIGNDEEDLISRINKIGNKNIIYYGHSQNPSETLQAGDVFCLPSYREGFGTSIIEASLLKLPIICSDTYGLAETIIDMETGLRHEVRNVESLYKQLLKLSQNDDLRKKMGNSGRDYVLANFSSDNISTHWLNFYNSILE